MDIQPEILKAKMQEAEQLKQEIPETANTTT
jgi:hypothetical protein